MKKFLGSLPARLIIGVIVGIALGLFSANLYIGETDVGSMIMQVVLTVKSLLGSLINFCVPLIIIGFIAPSITRLRSNASKMLGLALILAYASSVCAALMSMGAGYAIIPSLSIQSAAEGLRELPELLFDLEIAPIMTVMSALIFSVLVGLAATWTHARTTTQVLEEFQQIVLSIVTKVVIPILPFFHYQTAACIPHCYPHCHSGSLHLDDRVVRPGRCQLRLQSYGGCEALRPRLPHRCGYYVLRRHPGCGSALRPKVLRFAP